MSPLLAPLLAQMITVGVGDRTEARYLRVDDKREEIQTTPDVKVALAFRRADVSLTYAPSLLITPLERTPHQRLLLHVAALSADYRWQRTTFGFGSNLRFGDVNFRVAALQQAGTTSTTPTPDMGKAPSPGDQPITTPGGTPAPTVSTNPTAATPQQQTQIVNRAVKHLTSTTSLTFSHLATRELTFPGFATYAVSGGMNVAARRDYPFTRGWFVGSTGVNTQRLGEQDTLTTSVVGQALWSSNQNDVLGLLSTESWRHRLRPATRSSLSLGLSVTREARTDGLVAVSIFPTAGAGIDDAERLAHGQLVLTLNVFSAPAFDAVRATVDPRVGVRGTLGWSRDDFFTTASAGAAKSVAPQGNNAAAFDSYDGSFQLGYSIFDGVVLDAGARGTAQRFQQQTAVPPSWTTFVGLTLGHSFRLNGGH